MTGGSWSTAEVERMRSAVDKGRAYRAFLVDGGDIELIQTVERAYLGGTLEELGYL
jgi:hypothetical protein